MKKPIVLITGSNGLLGSQLVKYFNRVSISCIASSIGLDRFSLGQNHYVDLDITSYEQCQNVLNQYQPSIIINSAAMTNVDDCEKNQTKCRIINSDSIDNFIPYIQSKNPHFIHLSTDMVFDGLQGNYNEEDICQPVNFYGFSKLQAELKILKSIPRHTIVRTSMLYDIVGDNFVTWVKSKLNNHDDLKIVDDQYRTPTYVGDLVVAISQIIKLEKYGLYHVSSDEKLSIFDIVCDIVNGLNLDHRLVTRIKSKDLNQIAERPLDSSLSIKKAKSDFGFSPLKFKNTLNKIL